MRARERLHQRCIRVVDHIPAPGFIHTPTIAHPHCRRKRQALKRLARVQLAQHRGWPALRDFLRTVRRNLMHAVLEFGVGEARQERVSIGLPIGAREMRSHFVRHQAMNQRAHGGLCDAIGNHRQPRHRTQRRHRRVAAVEHAQLGFFKRAHIVHYRHPGALQTRAIG